MGVLSAFLWAFPLSFVIFYTIKITVGLRVSESEEIEGLDLTEHGIYTYPPAIVSGISPIAETPVAIAQAETAESV